MSSGAVFALLQHFREAREQVRGVQGARGGLGVVLDAEDLLGLGADVFRRTVSRRKASRTRSNSALDRCRTGGQERRTATHTERLPWQGTSQPPCPMRRRSYESVHEFLRHSLLVECLEVCDTAQLGFPVGSRGALARLPGGPGRPRAPWSRARHQRRPRRPECRPECDPAAGRLAALPVASSAQRHGVRPQDRHAEECLERYPSVFNAPGRQRPSGC